MTKLIVSIVSDQTIPNIEFINSHKGDNVRYLFITTDYCDNEKKHKTEDICKVCELSPENNDIIKIEKVEEYSIEMIQKRLGEYYKSSIYDEILVNATGGNKPTFYAVVEFFRNKYKTKIYYTDISNNNSFINLFNDTDKINKLDSLTPTQYLNAYGYNTDLSSKDEKYFKFANIIFDVYMKINIQDFQIIENIRNKIFNSSEKDFLNCLGFIDNDFNKKGRKNISKFINGGWLEYFFYEKLLNIKNKLKFEMNLGLTIKKLDKENELDIAITYKNTLYVFECKYTFKDNGKYYNLHEYIYKLDSLNGSFGLRPKSSLVTFDTNSDLDKDFIDKSKGYKEYKERMDLLNIGLLTRDDFLNEKILLKKIAELLRI